jgi:hypothetical protein
MVYGNKDSAFDNTIDAGLDTHESPMRPNSLSEKETAIGSGTVYGNIATSHTTGSGDTSYLDSSTTDYSNNVNTTAESSMHSPVIEKEITVYGIYSSIDGAERGVNALKNSGFGSENVSALFPDKQQSNDFAHEKGTKAPEGGTVGGATGTLLGGTLGWLAGVGSLAIPGVGPFIAAGPIMAALAGAGVGATVGALSGILIGLGIPEYEAKQYEGRVKEGGILVSVLCNNRDHANKAKDILERTGATDIASTGINQGENGSSQTLSSGV